MENYNNFSGPLRNQFPLPASPPTLPPQGPDLLAPGYGNFSPVNMQNQDPQNWHQQPSQYRSQLPDLPMYATYSADRLAAPSHGAPRTLNDMWPGNMFQRQSGGVPSSNMNAAQFPNPPPPATPYLYPHPRYMPPNRSSPMESPARPIPMQPNTMHSANLSPPPHPSPSLSSDLFRHGAAGPISTAPLRHNYPGIGAMPPSNNSEGRPMRGGPIAMEPRPQFPSSNRANRSVPSQRPHPSNLQAPTLSERETAGPPSNPSHRPERSMSPRTSNRRSFDRYSTDLSISESSPESDASHNPTHRSNRRRMDSGQDLDSRANRALIMAAGRGPHHDPNIPTASQIQQLKDGLGRYVRNQLGEGVSPTCDICQKDYSETLVEPSEEEEVAVKVSCGHVFGEHCLHTWFDTCKTHKNKVTCPMCRTLLIQPMRRRQHHLIQMLSQAGYPGVDRLLYSDHGRTMGSLEGDFAHT